MAGENVATLEAWGWAPDFADSYRRFLESSSSERLFPARVVSMSRGVYHLATAEGEVDAPLLKRVRRAASGSPVVGDWVVVETASAAGADPRIVHVLERRSRLSRKAAGARTEEQVVAANLDAVFLVMGLDGDFNLRRLERFVAMATESGAVPVVVLTKADLAADAEAMRQQAEEASPGTTVVAVAALANENLEPLAVHLASGRTVAMVGASGAGKSTLLNALCGEEVMRTAPVREGDDRGRHTTTHRRLVPLPGGGLLIDNPGIRELQLWADDDSSLEETFDDIEELARECRFPRLRPRSRARLRRPRRDREPAGWTRPGCATTTSCGKSSAAWSSAATKSSRRAEDRRLGSYYKSVQQAKNRRR